MPKHACPICGDPNVYPIWIDEAPPQGCPDDQDWMDGHAPSIRTVAECARQRRQAAQAALWRREVPEAFDAAGNILPDGLGLVLTRLAERGITPLPTSL